MQKQTVHSFTYFIVIMLSKEQLDNMNISAISVTCFTNLVRFAINLVSGILLILVYQSKTLAPCMHSTNWTFFSD